MKSLSAAFAIFLVGMIVRGIFGGVEYTGTEVFWMSVCAFWFVQYVGQERRSSYLLGVSKEAIDLAKEMQETMESHAQEINRMSDNVLEMLSDFQNVLTDKKKLTEDTIENLKKKWVDK